MKFIATLTALLAALISPLTVFADTADNVVSGETPFVLIARLHAMPKEADVVLRLSEAADEAVNASEPGMLLHTFDQDPSDPLGFVWTEVYANSAALIFHLENPPLQKYLADVSPLLDSFTVELYGEVSAEAINMLRSTGTPTTYFQSKFGYVRDLTP
jgi:autoinducer 2-degrading protein